MTDALFVDPNGIYPKLLGREHCWANDPETAPGNGPRTRDDAREYDGPGPVVVHPPCNLWGPLANVNYARWGGEHNRPGNDGGCFASALASVRRCGGVLEHPAGTRAWGHFRLPDPSRGWYGPFREWDGGDEYVCEVWQSAYGHRARKRTWLLYCGVRPPFELRWDRNPGTHQIGGGVNTGNNRLPKLGKREASATPEAFALALIRLAEWSRG